MSNMLPDSTTNIRGASAVLVPLYGAFLPICQNVRMTKVRPRFKEGPPRHFLREWRKHRGFTVEHLADLVGVTHGAISQLERGKVSYTQPMLEALAVALACSPADIVMRNPLDESAPWSILENLQKASPDDRARIVRAVQALTEGLNKTGTEG
jgi:transcriptional regulator with XRE-family HTH domain